MPAAIHSGGERHPTGNVQPQGNGEHTITARGATAPFGYRQARRQRGNARMDIAGAIKRVIKIECVPHSGID
jgi:hypothetical protein